MFYFSWSLKLSKFAAVANNYHSVSFIIDRLFAAKNAERKNGFLRLSRRFERLMDCELNAGECKQTAEHIDAATPSRTM